MYNKFLIGVLILVVIESFYGSYINHQKLDTLETILDVLEHEHAEQIAEELKKCLNAIS